MNVQEWLEAGKPWNVILHGDCMDLMKHFDDKEINLSIVDPPYGIGAGKGVGVTRGKENQYTVKDWDSSIPEQAYWDELWRVSKNQIVWGGNYMTDYLKPSRGWIYWQKMMGGNYADGELAWTSFDRNLKEFTKRSAQGNRFHPTQKPVALYRWILQNYAKPGDKIIDTHSGSGSCACACHLEKFDFLAIELDPDYHAASVKRLDELKSQGRLF